MLIKKIKTLNRNNIVTIFKGNFLSKLVLVIGGLILAKLYGSADYGAFSIYISIATISATLLSLGIEHLIILETRISSITNHYNSANTLGLGLMGVLILLFFIIPFHFIDSFHGILGLISGYLILYVNNSKLLLSKIRKFKWISFLTICDAVVSFLTQSVFLYFNIEDGLIWGSFIGFLFAFVVALLLSKKRIDLPNFRLFISHLKKRKDLVTLAYPSTLLNAMGNNIMPILMGYYFLESQVGEYALAVRILSVPLLLISSSIAVVYYPKAVEILENKSLKALFQYTKKMSLYNFFIILGLFILLNTIGVYLLKLIFNKDWNHLPLFILMLSVGYLARSLVNPIADVLTILKKNQIDLLFNIYLFVANFVVLFIGKNYGFEWLVGSFSFFISLGYGALYFYITFYLENNNEFYQKNHRVSNISKDK